MGLDTVELVVAVERAFGIDIPNDRAASMRTPRDLAGCVAAGLPLAPSGPCETRRAFHRLRRALGGALPGARLRPGTRAEEVSDRRGWPGVWERARRADGGADWPDAPWPRRPVTLGALALRLVPPVVPPDTGRGEAWTRERISLRVREVVADELGIESFAMGDGFVRDLGLD